ncbi:hypothetical protein [Myroides odoratus]|uniref:Uncharacterized protein n=1 Tax=Myroides odoratus TaxID=256 RepID=A0A378RMS0_MYROD|nr:hypothetical protein [Myroides odoratus]QQU04304.1 hypothetical protein I6I89_03200 [Myroides odoratus]STZ28275.1 Uncharacterised protein [Myroides odoratus]
MKTVHLKLFFPKNWNRTKQLEIYHQQELLASVSPNESIVIQLPQEATSIHWKLSHFKNSIALPEEDSVYLLLSMDLGEGFIQPYFKTWQSKCIQGRIVSQVEFEQSNQATCYPNKQTWLPIAKLDRPILYIGLLIGVISLLYAIYAQTTWSALLFLLSGGTIVSLLILIFEKNNVALGDYKGRMWASIGSFILIILMIPRQDYSIQILLFILTIGFVLRFLYHIRKLHATKQLH